MPVIMLTARDEERDKIFGFELGADDYVAKPFSVKELMARVKSLLKRSGKKNAEDRIDIGNLQINLNSHLVFINDDEIPLTSKEYDLLIYFINNQNIALSREQIIDRVWGYDYYGDFRTVDTHIKRLRVKINDADVKIATVRNVGYRFEVN
jgi:DNA-binding response OmpR family regulator